MLTRKFLIALFVLMLGARPLAASAVTAKDLESLQRQVAEKNMEHKRLQAQSTQISHELTMISQKMVRRARQIQNTEEALSKMENELLHLQADLQAKEAEFASEDESLRKTLYALQNLAMKPTESLFVQPLTPVEIIRSAMLLRETVPSLAEEAAFIKKKLDEIVLKKTQVEKQVAKIATNKQTLEQEQEKMKNLVAQKAQLRGNIESKTAATRDKIKQLAAQAKDIKELLIKLENERIERERLEAEQREKERQQQEEQMARLRREKELLEQARKEREQEQAHEKESLEDQPPKDDLKNYNPEFIKDVKKNFAKAKGNLSMPARGAIVVAYGQETAKGVTSKGISIQTRKNAQVTAPFDGSVIFAGAFRGYGKLIIIDHGQGYMSLLAGLENADCEVGQMLLAGEPIGQMPDSTEAKLYVELRKDNKPINPTSWIEK